MTNAALESPLEAINENVIYQNPLLRLKIWELYWDVPTYGIPERWRWHYHKEVEFLVVLEGQLGVQTKDDSCILGPGDVMLLGASQPHRTYKSDPTAIRQVVFQVDLAQHFDQSTMPYLSTFSELTRPLGELNYIFRENAEARQEAFRLVMDIYEESQQKQRGYEMSISSSIKRLLLLLLRSDYRGVLGRTDDTELLRLRPALDYVDRHLGEKIAVEDVCGLLNLSYHYFIKYFKKAMGLSFVDYVNYKRVKTAERLLLTRDLSIMEVGFEVGIPNMAQFYKLFKRHNQCSPKEFRQRMRSQAGPGGDGV
ncbi:AraC family transcriptional regulator [Paenibacillus mucilaginosus]|uniref:AraC family transcriptional regulator n=2 Tax=Paenibacillus mucilaginosus TaxID=61624 RepID=H6NPS1_9BACL|nr:AraC family transcriptional regulator [Paenibacillus mucilaginosus]AEI45769.1 Transcriptional regulator, AraC [Paenibacillus mucilaginosus KNP414]AFC33427.1 AraC family transcriptional regulator [Paenibacillus mucilaginosus 3016]MCG7215046.1 AraC family transcriptional regulator [Paenibacillus mucilaginosus]WDM27145.1 helix-turn-helix domain-containing protein [Paenibacillus mucilaginosus]WFA21835.1 AraC family transcriptional regulator [Paenibacillus mucilaginosus]